MLLIKFIFYALFYATDGMNDDLSIYSRKTAYMKGRATTQQPPKKQKGTRAKIQKPPQHQTKKKSKKSKKSKTSKKSKKSKNSKNSNKSRKSKKSKTQIELPTFPNQFNPSVDYTQRSSRAASTMLLSRSTSSSSMSQQSEEQPAAEIQMPVIVMPKSILAQLQGVTDIAEANIGTALTTVLQDDIKRDHVKKILSANITTRTKKPFPAGILPKIKDAASEVLGLYDEGTDLQYAKDYIFVVYHTQSRKEWKCRYYPTKHMRVKGDELYTV